MNSLLWLDEFFTDLPIETRFLIASILLFTVVTLTKFIHRHYRTVKLERRFFRTFANDTKYIELYKSIQRCNIRLLDVVVSSYDSDLRLMYKGIRINIRYTYPMMKQPGEIHVYFQYNARRHDHSVHVAKLIGRAIEKTAKELGIETSFNVLTRGYASMDDFEAKYA